MWEILDILNTSLFDLLVPYHLLERLMFKQSHKFQCVKNGAESESTCNLKSLSCKVFDISSYIFTNAFLNINILCNRR